jgi:hypothetical protein
MLLAAGGTQLAAQTFKSEDGITWGYDYKTHHYRPVSNLLPSLEEQRLQAEIDNLNAQTRHEDALTKHENADANRLQGDVRERHSPTEGQRKDIP